MGTSEKSSSAGERIQVSRMRSDVLLRKEFQSDIKLEETSITFLSTFPLIHPCGYDSVAM